MKKILTLQLFLFWAMALNAQQVADTLFSPTVDHPAYSKGQGSIIFIDEAHHNFHTLSGRFKPFANLLEKDGYILKPLTQVFTADILAQAKILVIANAIHPDNLERWSLPTPSAFSENEISALNAWVKAGGSLFLIADHMPFPGAAEPLAASFGIKFYNGFARKKRNRGNDIFKVGTGLMECSLTKGRNEAERITSLQSFTGQAFQIPDGATPVILFSADYELSLPQTAWQFTKETQTISAENFVQGAYMSYGQGRVVVFGEAAMFTAQQQNGKNKFGMNSPTAAQNAQFLLNTIHWLDRLMD